MQSLTFVTTNSNKLNTARIVLEPFGIVPEQATLDIAEIQGEDTEAIARDKAQKAYDTLGKPIVVTDDCWEIPALKGFPGAYMHSMNIYFTPEDWLRLIAPLTDRRVILRQQLVYQDADVQKLFAVEIPGTLLSEIRGTAPEEPSATLISLTPDGKSIAEIRVTGGSALAASKQNAWQLLGAWLQKEKT